jgi:hypothetical protein
MSGPQATIAVLDNKGTYDPGCSSQGFFSATKLSTPQIIPPLEETTVTYTVLMENIDESTNFIYTIEDYLPPGFEYIMDSVYGITEGNPTQEMVVKNGVERQKLTWAAGVTYPGDSTTQLPSGSGYSVAASESVNMTFQVIALQSVSGTYFNEVLVSPKSTPTINVLSDIDPDYTWTTALSQTYSWNSGTVIVPSYDSETGANGENISTNLALTPDGVIINSWHIK